MAELTKFGKSICIALINNNKSQKWLIDQVQEKTGLYFDGGYLYKIKLGRVATPKIVTAIEGILDIKYER